jgi:hypothetical protein
MEILKNMSVVNVRVSNIRPKYQNLREWCQDPNNVYVGRAGVVFVPTEDGSKERYPPVSSPFCNPFKMDNENSREEVIEKFRNHLEKQLLKKPELIRELVKLKGKNLGCWCQPERCHAEVLLEMIEIYS